MQSRWKFFLTTACFAAVIAGVALFASRAPAEPVKYTPPPETTRLRPGPGVEVATAHCTMCHSVDYIEIQPPMPPAFWKSSVEKMRTKFGAPIPDAQVDTIVNYLVTAYGKPEAESAKPDPAKR